MEEGSSPPPYTQILLAPLTCSAPRPVRLQTPCGVWPPLARVSGTRGLRWRTDKSGSATRCSGTAATAAPRAPDPVQTCLLSYIHDYEESDTKKLSNN